MSFQAGPVPASLWAHLHPQPGSHGCPFLVLGVAVGGVLLGNWRLTEPGFPIKATRKRKLSFPGVEVSSPSVGKPQASPIRSIPEPHGAHSWKRVGEVAPELGSIPDSQLQEHLPST